MKMTARPVIHDAETQKKIDAVKEHYRNLMSTTSTGPKARHPVQHYAVGIDGKSIFLPHEEVDTRWYRVNNSVRKSKWKCLGYDEGYDEEGDKLYDGGNSEEKVKTPKKDRKSYRSGKKGATAATAPTKAPLPILESQVNAWADE
jgi:hypothetical protein